MYSLSLGVVVLVALWAWEPRVFVYLYQRLAYRMRDEEMFLPDGQTLFPQKHRVDSAAASLRQEITALRGDLSTVPRAHDVDAYNREISAKHGPGWRTLYLKAYGGWFDENCRLCPRAYALFKDMDNVIAVMYSVMEPGNAIPPHRGKLRGFLRYQLPLIVPASGECSITVGGQRHRYVAGQGILFDDNNEHSVVNDTNGVRVVLFLDVRKPAGRLVTLLDKLLMRAVVLSPRFKRAKVSLR